MPGVVTVRLFHRLRELVARKTVSISPVPGSVVELVTRFIESYPEAGEEMLDDNGELSHRYVVAINENLVKRADWDGVKLNDGDEVAFLTMLSGG